MIRATDTPSAITGQDACRLDRSRKANNQPGYLRFTVVAPTVIIENFDRFGYWCALTPVKSPRPDSDH
jgi:hypothetical protein